MTQHNLLHSARHIAPLAWPVFIGQVAVLAFSTVDTVMVARYAALDLAALAVGAAAYITIFVGFMGVVLAIGPIAGQLFGARKLVEAGEQLHQAAWLALGLSVLGSALLLMPDPFLYAANASPAVAEKVRAYLGFLAIALPPALLFQSFRGFNTAVSRPKVVMSLQLVGLALKVPLNAMLIYGIPAWHIPEMGAAGCGLASAIVMWLQLLLAWWVLQRDPFYAPFGLHVARLNPPDWRSLKELLRLGVPMGLSILIEVTGFTFMAIFISRIGATPVAGHQLAANLVSLMFMMPLAIANATTTLVAQAIGANAPADARRLGWHGLQIGTLIAALLGTTVYLTRESVLGAYTSNPVIIAAAMPLLAWVAVFHIADAAQTIAAFVMRAYRVATVPMVIYAVALWGVGLGGGYVLAFNLTGLTPASLLGAPGFWAASVTGLVLSGVALCSFMGWLLRQKSSA
ncbi:MAG: MATE family efflux transporter [Cytophagales bacterium]|nr:MATE family efflux transporter [Rhizobacter sp.]